MKQHSALALSNPAVEVKHLLGAWERFVLLSNWSRTAAIFSTADLIVLTLIFASIAHVLSRRAILKNPKFDGHRHHRREERHHATNNNNKKEENVPTPGESKQESQQPHRRHMLASEHARSSDTKANALAVHANTNLALVDDAKYNIFNDLWYAHSSRESTTELRNDNNGDCDNCDDANTTTNQDNSTGDFGSMEENNNNTDKTHLIQNSVSVAHKQHSDHEEKDRMQAQQYLSSSSSSSASSSSVARESVIIGASIAMDATIATATGAAATKFVPASTPPISQVSRCEKKKELTSWPSLETTTTTTTTTATVCTSTSLLLQNLKKKPKNSSNSNSSNNDALFGEDDDSFLQDYSIAHALSRLKPIEIFYVGVIVAKMVLDIDEPSFHGTVFGAAEFALLISAVRDDALLRTVSPNLHLRRFRRLKRAIFATQLYVLDVSLPLGRRAVSLPPFPNTDDKIEAYMALILQRAPIPEDYQVLLHDA